MVGLPTFHSASRMVEISNSLHQVSILLSMLAPRLGDEEDNFVLVSKFFELCSKALVRPGLICTASPSRIETL